MKKRTKIMTVVVSLALIGGGIMLNNNYKINGNIFDFTSREDRQLAYLKEHEQEIVDFVKAQNPKIESVQIDWDETFWGKGGGMFETTYYIRVFGKFNNIENSSWGVQIYYSNESGKIDMDTLGQGGHIRIGGDIFE
ncbi:hypothetical protein [Streptococcus oriscaviae]|uniref:Lipoprotein n=1 Tax=Streptococcus oriscaviae TaxID=2781599 RepID=A0ABX7YNM6_9STRE|nr:hypothetical protein [Streptococcus oriscaviae]QUE55272.1 hypothetical protein INT76_05190 [Streptococcus oriscaviae]